jgi:hypothetical protein
MKKIYGIIAVAVAAVTIQAAAIDSNEEKDGFVSLFNGKDLSGWIGDTNGYKIENGELVCHGRNLYTDKEYSDFIMRFEFKLPPGANNGLGIRTPTKGDPAYAGMELQILDNTADKYKNLQPYQFHGSVYGLVPAKRGFLKPVGEWNYEEVIAIGPKIKVILNGTVITDTDLSKIKESEHTHPFKKHPGRLNKKGHLAFLGHGASVRFRDIRVKDLAQQIPEGFTSIFNGKNLDGWKGLLSKPNDNPIKRAELSKVQLKEAQVEAYDLMRKHWSVENGVLVHDGKGRSICTAKDYGDFEMLVDWKIEKGGDSGIYLRGTPQVQIWDNDKWKVGSGGLYNNKKHPSKPLVVADNPTGEWNTFRIKMVGDKVTVHLNGKKVTDTVLENYWDRSQPLFPTGQIALQHPGSKLYFKNIYIREIKQQSTTAAPTPIFEGKTLNGWIQKNGKASYRVENGAIIGKTENGSPNSFLCSAKEYGDFELNIEVKLINDELNSGIQIRSKTKPPQEHEEFGRVNGPQVEVEASGEKGAESGYIYGEACGGWMTPKDKLIPRKVFKSGEWNKYRILAKGSRIQTWINGQQVSDLVDEAKYKSHPKGFIGLQVHAVGDKGPYEVAWRNIKITEL